MARRFKVALGVLESLIVMSIASTCLQDVFPPEFMQNITVGGNSTPVKIVYGGWASSHLLAEISGIIIREKMGFHAEVHDLPLPSSGKVMAALADCTTLDASDCNPGPPGLHAHLALEVWEYYASGSRAALLAAVPDRLPVYVGYPEGLGYYGKESMFLKGDIVKQALASQVFLEWYQAYNASWPTAVDYFANHNDLQTPELPCSEVQLLNGKYLEGYLAATGDTGAARMEDGVQVPDCRDEWMLSRTCRERVAAGQGCIPVISYMGWGYEAFLQLSYFHDMPMAFGAFTGATWTSIPINNSVLFYWWFPDTAFIHLDATEIQFPPANLDEQKLGVYRTMVDGMRTFRVAHAELAEAEPLLTKFLNNVELSIQTVTAMIRPYGGKDAYELACEWMQTHTDLWQAWVPDPTDCFPGQGLKLDVSTGRDVCEWCAAGFKSEKDANLTLKCVQCPRGESQPTMGASECVPCAVGTFADSNGSQSCTACLVGSYADVAGSSACQPCEEGESTFELVTNIQGVSSWNPVRGAWNASMCGCDVGMRRDRAAGADGKCIGCTEGIDCRGMDLVHVEPGYYTPSGELSIFRCWGDQQMCVGGVLGEGLCNDGRTDLTCAKCESGKTKGENGTCKECGEQNMAPFVVACVLGVLVVCVLYKVVDGTNLTDRSKVLALLMCEASMFVLFVQQLGVLGKLSMQFPDPFRTLISIAAFFNFDFEILKLGCISPGLNPTMEYAAQMAAILILFATVCLLHVINVVVRFHGDFHSRFYSLTGTIGTVFMIFLTSMVNAAVVPFESQRHPNNLATLRRYPTVITWEGSHYEMVGLAIPYLSIPLSFVVFIAVIVYRFPHAMAKGDISFLQKYAVFFKRFSPGEYWYILFFVLRNTTVAMSPALPDVLVQVLVNTILLTASFGILAKFSPWVADFANNIDIVIHMVLIVFMAMVGFFAGDANGTTIGITATVFIVVVLLAFIVGVCTILYRKIVYRKHSEWRYFLCHHKGGTGAFARLLKTVFLQKSQRKNLKVWLDCDNLTNMEKLFDYVGDSDCVVALMSSELFMRPWCMGELVTAHRRHIQVIPVKFPTYVPITDEFIAGYESYVDISCLAPYAVNLGMIQVMLEFVREKPTVVLPHVLDMTAMHQVSDSIDDILRGQKIAEVKKQNTRRSEKTSTGGKNLVIADQSNLESVATALVLIQYVRKEVSEISNIPQLLNAEDEVPMKTLQCCIFILTNGAFSQPFYIKAMLQVVGTRFLPIIAEDGFRFPSQQMLDEVVETAPARLTPHGIVEDPEVIAAVIQNLFKEIAVVFAPQNYSSNHELLQTKAKAIRARLASGFLGALSGARRSRTFSDTKGGDNNSKTEDATAPGGDNNSKTEDADAPGCDTYLC